MSKGVAEWVTWPTFLNVCTPFISRERLKLEASNLSGRLDTGDTNQKNAKLGQHGREQGHMTYFFLNFGTPQRRWVKRLETVNNGPLMYKAMQQPLWENH